MISEQDYSTVTVNPRFCYLTPKEGVHSNMAEEISSSLSAKKRFIHPKFFYDDTGSRIFDEICKLPEYYLTRSETEILDSIGPEIAEFIEDDHVLVELGSGSARKTGKLLEALLQKQGIVQYYPIDISGILKESSLNLQRSYQNLAIIGIIDQYEGGLDFVSKMEQRKLIAFLGSSLGNFDNSSAIRLLRRIYHSMSHGDLFLLGLDLVKETSILEKAYNDAEGLTGKFNLNVLERINRELGGNFDTTKFEHLAFYNSNNNRIEMHLRSKCDQQIFISKVNLEMRLSKDETILTEYSYKYTVPQIEQISNMIGFKIEKIWFDKNKFFSMILFSV